MVQIDFMGGGGYLVSLANCHLLFHTSSHHIDTAALHRL